MFKFILTAILFCVTPLITLAGDSFLDVKCPEKSVVIVNGYKQTIGGTHRRYTFEAPNGESLQVRLVVILDNKVLHNSDVALTGGLAATVNLLKEDKKNNFDLFGKIEKPALKKPDFSCIINTPKKEEPKPVEKVKTIIEENCVTGY